MAGGWSDQARQGAPDRRSRPGPPPPVPPWFRPPPRSVPTASGRPPPRLPVHTCVPGPPHARHSGRRRRSGSTGGPPLTRPAAGRSATHPGPSDPAQPPRVGSEADPSLGRGSTTPRVPPATRMTLGPGDRRRVTPRGTGTVLPWRQEAGARLDSGPPPESQ